jgi:hypothetical protein
MTPQENELIAMKDMAAWRIRKLLAKYGSLRESELFNRASRGLRRSDWEEVVNKLLSEGVLSLTRSDEDIRRIPIFSLAQPAQTEVTDGIANNLNH